LAVASSTGRRRPEPASSKASRVERVYIFSPVGLET
jgi:hypothetical protein